MNKHCMCFVILCILLIALCSCMNRGPYSAPLKQSTDAIVKIDLLDGRSEDELFERDTYANCIICSLDSSDVPAFAEGLLSVEFYMPSFEPSRHLGEIAARIYYADGSSDLLGSNCSYSFDSNFNILDRSIYYPDEDAFYALFAKFIDPQLLPRK